MIASCNMFPFTPSKKQLKTKWDSYKSVKSVKILSLICCNNELASNWNSTIKRHIRIFLCEVNELDLYMWAQGWDSLSKANGIFSRYGLSKMIQNTIAILTRNKYHPYNDPFGPRELVHTATIFATNGYPNIQVNNFQSNFPKFILLLKNMSTNMFTATRFTIKTCTKVEYR